MTEVHIVQTGEYSDTRISYVTLDKAKADDWVELHNTFSCYGDARVSTFETDVTAVPAYTLSDLMSVKWNPIGDEYDIDNWWYPENGQEVNADLDILKFDLDGVHVVGKDPYRVKKVARARINQIKARREGIA